MVQTIQVQASMSMLSKGGDADNSSAGYADVA